MTGDPDPTHSRGGASRSEGVRGRGGAGDRAAAARCRQVEPARYVAGLLGWQGGAWLVLTALGLMVWIVTLPADFVTASSGTTVLWRGAQLLALAIGASLGGAEVGMACRLRGGPRLLVAVALGFPVAVLAALLVVAAVSVIVAGSVLELLALSGAVLAAEARPVPWPDPAANLASVLAWPRAGLPDSGLSARGPRYPS